MPSQVTHYY